MTFDDIWEFQHLSMVISHLIVKMLWKDDNLMKLSGVLDFMNNKLWELLTRLNKPIVDTILSYLVVILLIRLCVTLLNTVEWRLVLNKFSSFLSFLVVR